MIGLYYYVYYRYTNCVRTSQIYLKYARDSYLSYRLSDVAWLGCIRSTLCTLRQTVVLTNPVVVWLL